MPLAIDCLKDVPLPMAVGILKATLEPIAHQLLGSKQASVELLITTDERMQQLNRVQRGVDTTTDVLSLPTAIDSKQGRVIPIGIEPIHLGTIVISLPQATRQIGQFGSTIETELLGLAAHGLRHLLGQNHDDGGAWQKMTKLERSAKVGT